MKILYIDNKNYIHNADSHVDFLASLDKSGIFTVVGYGNNLSKKIDKVIRPNLGSQGDLSRVAAKYKPDLILTYNSGPDIAGLYSWISDDLSRMDIPKFHIATDFMRHGFEPNQASFLEYIGYTAVFF